MLVYELLFKLLIPLNIVYGLFDGTIDTAKNIVTAPFKLYNGIANIGETVSNAILGFFADLAASFINGAFKLMLDFIVPFSDLGRYFDYTPYLTMVQIISASLLTVVAVNEGLKSQYGGIIGGDQRGIGELVSKTLIAGGLIYFLPWFLINVLIPINNNLMKAVQSINGEVVESNFSSALVSAPTIASAGSLMILVTLVLGIALLALGILGAIRYVQLVICCILAPVCAAFYISSSERVDTWMRETCAVVFTQLIHIFLLKMMITVIATVKGIPMSLLCIGIVFVALKGPAVLRTFFYSSGLGGAGGQMTNMMAMKFMVRGR